VGDIRQLQVGHLGFMSWIIVRPHEQTFRNLVAIRNSLVTLAYPVRVRITFSDDPDDFEEIRVYIRDSYLMLPAGQRSLAAAGELIGKPKIKLHNDPEIELDLKRNMKVVRDNNWELFREYALLDAEISALYFEQVTQLYRAVTGTNRIPTSLSNIGPQLLVNDWESRTPPIDRLKMIGKESHKEEVWNDKTGSFYTQTSEPYIEELFYHIDFVTACFHGGRGEQMWFGPSERDDFSDYDLASAYPTAMAMLREPLWDTIRPTRDMEDLRFGKFSFAWVEFEFPNSVRYPTLPVRTDHGLIFPRRGLSRCCAPEIEVARNLGAEIRIHDMKVAVKGKSRAYLTSDLKRLRRDLCRAFQQGEAGLEGLRDRITARQFADLLNSCGFEGDQTVTRQNVEYGLRGQFKQHETPPTIKVLRVLRKLSQVVPALRAQDLIPDLTGLPMLVRAIKVQ
jgi:hypothetical protein